MKNTTYKTIILLSLLLCTSLAFAQEPFVRIYPGAPSSVIPNGYSPSLPYCLEITIDGGFLIGGGVGDPDTLDMSKMQLRMVDNHGGLIWEIKDRVTLNDEIYDVVVMQDSILICTANIGGRAALVRRNVNGGIVWAKDLVPSADTCSSISSICKTLDNEVIVGGGISDCNSIEPNIFIARYNLNGDLIWFKEFDLDYSNAGLALTIVSDSIFYITGFTNELVQGLFRERSFLAKAKTNGDLVFFKVLTELDRGASIISLSDTLLAISGAVGDEAGLILVNDTGKVLSTSIDSFPEFNYGIKVLNDQNFFYILQKASKSVTYNNITYIQELIRIVKKNSSDLTNVFEKVLPIDTFQSCSPRDIEILDDGKLAVLFYLNSKDCPGCTGLVLLDSTGCVEEWCITDLLKVESNLIISVSPNPFEEYINVKIEDNQYSKIDLQLTDIEGKVVYRSEITTYLEKRIDARELKPGMYFLTLLDQDKKWVKKIIKM